MILIKIYFLLGLIMNVVVAVGLTNKKFVEFVKSRIYPGTFEEKLKKSSQSAFLFAIIELILFIIACNA